MENSIYIGLSRQLTLQRDMNIVANNIANVNTPGYRGQNLVFEEFVSDPRGADFPIRQVFDYGQYQITKPGPMRQTGNPLDVAVNGPGFLGVQTPDGIKYTRAGNFETNANGELVTPDGFLVADAGGGTITIPGNAKHIMISETGAISTDQGQIAQLMLKEFDNVQKLDPWGSNLYSTDDEGKPAENSKVAQGMLEGSNVEAVLEITRMIEVSREYQSMQRTLQSEHERQRTAIQRLTRGS